MRQIKEYIGDISYLLGDERRKLPGMIMLFLSASFVDLIGIGLIGPYIAMAIDSGSESVERGRVYEWIMSSIDLQNGKNTVTIFGMALLGVFFVKALFGFYINAKIISFSIDQGVILRDKMMATYQQMPYVSYLQRNSSEYIQSLKDYTDSFSSSVVILLKLISEGIVALAILCLLAFVHGSALGILVLVLGLTLFSYDRIFKKKVKIAGELGNIYEIQAIKGIQEGIRGLKELRILGREQYFQQKVRTSSEISASYSKNAQIIAGLPRYILEVSLVLFIVVLVGLQNFLGQSLPTLIPVIGMYGVAAMRLMPSANLLSTGLSNLRFFRYAISILSRDLKAKPTKTQFYNSDYNRPLEKFSSLRVSGVSFTYPGGNQAVLNNVSFEIEAGETIGFVGASGVGKTTLVDIILGLLESQAGDIFLNGRNLKSEHRMWRSKVAYLPQEVFLVDDTLKRNVTLGIPEDEFDDLRFRNAIQNAQLSEVLNQLPEGADTIIGESGMRLSGGERQRVALARAFFHEREVLILDEATSALDNRTEQEIMSQIRRLKGRKTIIVIAHGRLILDLCDRIYQLYNGEVFCKT